MLWENNLKVAAVLAAFNLGCHASCNTALKLAGRGFSKKYIQRSRPTQDVDSKKIIHEASATTLAHQVL